MDSFLLLRRLVAAIVFKGQTVSDYWWSRRTIFLTLICASFSHTEHKKRYNIVIAGRPGGSVSNLETF